MSSFSSHRVRKWVFRSRKACVCVENAQPNRFFFQNCCVFDGDNEALQLSFSILEFHNISKVWKIIKKSNDIFNLRHSSLFRCGSMSLMEESCSFCIFSQQKLFFANYLLMQSIHFVWIMSNWNFQRSFCLLTIHFLEMKWLQPVWKSANAIIKRHASIFARFSVGWGRSKSLLRRAHTHGWYNYLLPCNVHSLLICGVVPVCMNYYW